MKEPYGIEIVLPWPPSTNHTWGKARNKRTGKPQVYLTKDARIFRAEVAFRAHGCRKYMPIEGPLDVSVKLFPPDNRRRDEDNFAGKALFDAITHAGIWNDDSQIRKKTVEWGDVKKHGEVVVTIKQMPA